MFAFESDLKQWDALLPFLFNFALGYAIRRAKRNQVCLKLSGTHQLLVHSEDVINLMRDNINAVKKNTEALIDTIKDVCLQVIAEKTEYMLISHNQNALQNYKVKTANRSVENVAWFKYLGTITNQNLIYEETRSSLNSANACYH
jgi:hypothetical protein